jgi:purine-cytosine permease-like protein
MPVSWLPLVADYNRFGRGRRSAFTGTFLGYFIANVWLYTLGILLILGAGAEPSPAGIASGILALGGGTLAGILFLVGLLVGETDEAFADVYSGAMSLKNVFPKVRREIFVLGVTAVALLLAGWLTMERYESFLFLIGSVFVPLFGVFIAHYHVRRGDVTGRAPGAFVAWVLGFLVYHWIAPTGPDWWLDLFAALPGDALSVSTPWLSASIPSFFVALLVYLSGVPVSSRRKRGAR